MCWFMKKKDFYQLHVSRVYEYSPIDRSINMYTLYLCSAKLKQNPKESWRIEECFGL